MLYTKSALSFEQQLTLLKGRGLLVVGGADVPRWRKEYDRLQVDRAKRLDESKPDTGS
jgi:hypothetical protein